MSRVKDYFEDRFGTERERRTQGAKARQMADRLGTTEVVPDIKPIVLGLLNPVALSSNTYTRAKSPEFYCPSLSGFDNPLPRTESPGLPPTLLERSISLLPKR